MPRHDGSDLVDQVQSNPPAGSSLGDTILGLSRLRRQRETMMANLSEPFRLKLVTPLGRNPGDLRMVEYVPRGLPQGAPLVVVLHGCTQNAAAYDHGSGWSTLAERHGFALLFPEQHRGNNANLCFNWFQPEDVRAGHGEVQSIREMVEQSVRSHGLDPRRVFLTGLSAGGAMAAACAATSPEVFAACGIIAGLPFRAAASMREAFGVMAAPADHTPSEWGDKVRAAGPPPLRWPAMQIWHGTDDATVGPENGRALLDQWRDVLGLAEAPGLVEEVDGARHAAWGSERGLPALEYWSVPGLGHGLPITPAATDTDRAVGFAAPHMLESSVSSTYWMARRWGLLTQAGPRAAPGAETGRAQPEPAASGPASFIEKLLKGAGLIR